MPQFTVEFHPLKPTKQRPPSVGIVSATRPRRRAFGANLIESWGRSPSDQKPRHLTWPAPGAFFCTGSLSSSSIACTMPTFKSSPLHTVGGGQVTGFSAETGSMTKDSGTTLDHQRSFAQARRRALTRLRNGMELRWSPARSRDDFHRKFGDDSVDPGSAPRSADATRPQGSTGDGRE